MSDEIKELLLLMHNAKGIYRVTPDTDFETAQNLAMAMSDLCVTVTLMDGLLEYRLTDKGINVAEQYANEKESAVGRALINHEATEFGRYPALYKNRVNECVVLAINPTCGTVIKQANVKIEGEYALPVGTFQTCFIPFFVNEEWELLEYDSYTIVV